MNKFIKILNKYFILLIVISLFGTPWWYLRLWLFKDFPHDSFIFMIPNLVDYIIRITTIILLIFDFRKYKLKNVVISCISSLFVPFLGVVIFSIMYLLKEKEISEI
jgi:hypothetical protein